MTESPFIDDNTIYDDMPFLMCNRCSGAIIQITEELSATVHQMRFKNFIENSLTPCICPENRVKILEFLGYITEN